MSDFRDPFAAVRWELVPNRTVLVLIDLQNDFLHAEGWYAQHGIDISHMRRVIEPTQRLLEAARRAEIPVVWTRHGYRDARDAGPFLELRPFLKDGGLRLGTWGFELYSELEVRQEDWLVEKSRLSAFFNTKLETVLRALDGETVLIGGVLTNQCVAATSKDASFRDFKPIVVEECVGTTLPHLHEPAIEMMRVGWSEVQSLGETVQQLAQLRMEVQA
jgi:ureidoacrylate peracid hydrolase